MTPILSSCGAVRLRGPNALLYGIGNFRKSASDSAGAVMTAGFMSTTSSRI